MLAATLTRRTLALLAAVALGGLGCADDTNIREFSVDDVTKLVDPARKRSGASAQIYDTNGDKIRKEYGVIPGSKLLDDAGGYDLARLPAERATTLIFYCSSTWCSAAKTAARRARDAGYGDVGVLPVGIKGWKASGQPVEAI